MPRNNKQPSPQFQAFWRRVEANKHLPCLPPEVLQYWNERPQLIPHALELGFRSPLLDHENHARETLEKFIWATPWGEKRWKQSEILRFKKLLIWFLRQSKGLTEEVVIHSPFDPDDQTDDIIKFAVNASYYIHGLLVCAAPILSFYFVMRAIGCPLSLGTGSDGKVSHFYLTFNHCNAEKARRISWTDAMAGLETVEVK